MQVQFADVEADTAIGTTFAWEAIDLRTPAPAKIPAYSVSRSFPDVDYELTNPNFYREVAAYAAFQNLLRPVRLVVENTGSTSPDDIRVEIDVEEASGVSLKEYEPSEPSTYADHGREP